MTTTKNNTTTQTTDMTITVIKNQEKNGVELYFSGKPSDSIRQQLKDYGFHWHNTKKCWYAKVNDKTMLAVEVLSKRYKTVDAPAAPVVSAPVKKADTAKKKAADAPKTGKATKNC